MKKLISLSLVAAMAVSLVACGSPSTDTKVETTKVETIKTEATKAGETTAAAGNTKGGVLKIGGIGPTTGGTAIYGNAVKNGAELALKEINADGGIGGVSIEFSFQDDENDAEKAINAYNTLKDWGMQILMGTVTSNPCIAVAAKTKEDNMFQLTPSGSAVPCVQYDNAFRICFSDPNQGIASAQYIGSNKLATKIAVIYDSSDVYSSGIYEKFAGEAKNQGIEIVSAEAFTADSNQDFTVQLQKAQEAGAELVFLPIYYSQASLILVQANKMGFAPQFFGCDGLDGLLTVENFDVKLAENVMLLTPFAADAKDEKTQKFVAAYKENYKETPNQFAADAYDAMYTIKAAAEKAGVTSDMSVSDICEAMKKAMAEITVNGITGETITWTADGEPSKDPKAVKIVNGVYNAM